MFHVKPKENRNYNSTNTNKYNSRNHKKTVVEITPTTKNSRNKNLRKTIIKNIRLKNVVLI